jgi:hypothetical protein
MSQVTISSKRVEQLLALTKMLSAARSRADERAIATHERFNVFTTLLDASDEVRLHTRFLHCLLNPKGSHDCGSLFIDLFLATLTELEALDHVDDVANLDLPTSKLPWSVEKEVVLSSYGQIDLLLKQNRFAIAIENKIYAGEQPDQLARYAHYIRASRATMGRVIYLTLDGKTSSRHGYENYYRISYSEHILEWLHRCLRETYHIVPVNQVLLQYRRVVLKITGQMEDSAIMNSVSDFIGNNPDIVRFYPQIKAGIDSARAAFLDDLAAEIIKELRMSGYGVRMRPDVLNGRFGLDRNGALIITPILSSPLHGAPFEIWVEHIAKWEGLVVGIESRYEKPDLSSDTQQLLVKINAHLDKHSIIHDYHKASPQPSGRATHWPTGWHNLIHPINYDELARLLETPLAQTVSEICQKIRHHISLLEDAYREVTPQRPPAAIAPDYNSQQFHLQGLFGVTSIFGFLPTSRTCRRLIWFTPQWMVF